MQKSRLPFVLLVFLFAGLLLFELSFAEPAQAVQMPPTPMINRLAPPPTVYPPTQTDQGAQDYYQSCSICHGDRGQGLTAEWRAVIGGPDQNCWRSQCHGSVRPPNGFNFPKIVPPVIGAGVLNNFNTGLDVYHFLKLYMPYQAAGSLNDETYWDLTAYLLRANHYYSGNPILNAQSAAAIQIRPQSSQPQPQTGYSWQSWLPYLAVTAVLLLASLFWGIHEWRSRKIRSS
jgi:cytochrome c